MRRTCKNIIALVVMSVLSLPAYAAELQVKDLEIGTGAVAQTEKQVTVHYTGWLMNGTKFDSSRGRDRPFSFTIGARQVIPGWEEGVQGMKVGGRRELIIPPEKGYGARGVGDVIPPDSTLRFEVELLAVKDAPVQHVNVAELKDLLSKGVPIVDIRTPAEWLQTGVIEGSTYLPFRLANGEINRNFPRDLPKIAKPDQEVILICRSGNRSRAAAEVMTQRFGYQKIYNVRQGIRGWLRAKEPTVQPDPDSVKVYE